MNKLLNELMEKPIEIIFKNENNKPKEGTATFDNNEGINLNLNNNIASEEELNKDNLKEVNNINENQNNEKLE